jgi:hypothetical protein
MKNYHEEKFTKELNNEVIGFGALALTTRPISQQGSSRAILKGKSAVIIISIYGIRY